jgi:hypothetical protein
VTFYLKNSTIYLGLLFAGCAIEYLVAENAEGIVENSSNNFMESYDYYNNKNDAPDELYEVFQKDEQVPYYALYFFLGFNKGFLSSNLPNPDLQNMIVQ